MSSVPIAHPGLGSIVIVQFRQLAALLGAMRCRLMHHSISLPVNGHYRCWICLREFHADW